MMAVTAAIARASPNRLAQICAARSIGSKGKSSGLRTGPSYRPERTEVRGGRGGWRGIWGGATGDLRGEPRTGPESPGAPVDMLVYRTLYCLLESHVTTQNRGIMWVRILCHAHDGRTGRRGRRPAWLGPAAAVGELPPGVPAVRSAGAGHPDP